MARMYTSKSKRPPRTPRNKRRGWKAAAGFRGWGFGANVSFEKRAAKVVRRELLKQEEIKQFYSTATNAGPLHNNLYTFSPIQQLIVASSATSTSRVGDQVFLRKLVIQGDINTSALQSTVTYRILVFWNDQRTATTWGFNSVFGSTQLFQNNTYYAYALLNNKLGNKIICDRLVTCRSDIGSEIQTKGFKITCPIMTKVKWEQGSIYLQNSQLYVVVIPHVPGGSSGVTPTGVATINSLITFTDA